MNKGHCRTCKKLGVFGEGQTYCKRDGEFVRLNEGCYQHLHDDNQDVYEEDLQNEFDTPYKSDEWLENNPPEAWGVPNH